MIASSTLGYEDARGAIDAILAEVTRRGKAAVIVVADAHGEPIAFARMDGAPLSSIAVAANKAWTAARAGKPTADIGKKVRDAEQGFDIAYYGDPRFCGWGGGIPVRRDGTVVGSVAVSGLPEAEDMEVATVGAAAISGS
ncbi:MAG: heme-binding protein [Acidobacteriia bacterium]|nr:heme-binding protein [Terriglobia bacterium]